MANTGYIGVGPADRDPTVSDDSVTTAKIQDNAVTGPKIAMTSDAAGDILTYTGTDYARLGIGTATQVLKVNAGATAVEWAADTVNAGDVVGPGSATDDALARFNATTGKLIQNSTATLSDAGTLTATAFAGAVTGNVTGNVIGNVTGDIDGIVGGTTPAAGSFTSITATLDIDLAPDKNLQWSANEKITSLSSSSNDIALYAGGAERVRFAVGGGIGLAGANYGTSGQAMVSGGSAANPSWAAVGDASIGTAQEWTAQQNFNNTALVFDATQDWALAANQVATLTLTANTIFDAPTQMVDGAFYSLIIIQDATGGWTTSWNGVFKWAAATAPTLTTTAAAKDILVWRSDGVNMYEVGRQLNVS